MTNAMEIVKDINNRLDRIEAMLKEMKGEAQEAEAQKSEWDNYEALKADAAELDEMLNEWTAAFYVSPSQGEVKHARDAIYAIRVAENVFARRVARATCLRSGKRRAETIKELGRFAARLDRVNYSLNALIDEGKGENKIAECTGEHTDALFEAYSHAVWEYTSVAHTFEWDWLKPRAAAA